MKKMLIWVGIVSAIVVLMVLHGRATDFPTATAVNTLNYTLLGPTTSNKTGTAQYIEAASQHTIQVVTLCTNAVSNVISASLDNTNFFTIATNSVSASSTNGISLIGYRFAYIKANFTQTTANGSTNTVLYLGGR